MKTKPTFIRIPALCCLLAAVAAMAFPAAARAAITTSGNFKTGSPTPTLSITTPFSLTITSTGSVQNLFFDEWVTSDGSPTSATPSPGNQTLSYQINGGTTQTVVLDGMWDNVGSSGPGFTPNDGYVFFLNNIAVTAGQTLTFFPAAFTFASGGSGFNQPPSLFTGNAFVTTSSGVALSGMASVNTVPEPSTWALLGIGAGLLSLALSPVKGRQESVLIRNPPARNGREDAGQQKVRHGRQTAHQVLPR